MIECESLPQNLKQICTGEATHLPAKKINAYREIWGLPPLEFNDDRPEHVIHDGRADVPVETFRVNIKQIPPASRGCTGCGSNSVVENKPQPKIGPGVELSAIFAKSGVPYCQACVDLAVRMDGMGAAGCRENIDEIVDDIMPRARVWVEKECPWTSSLVPDCIKDIEIRRRVKNIVTDAIETHERKQVLRETVFKPVSRSPMSTPDDVVAHCQVVVKSFRRFAALKSFLKSLWHFYPSIEVIISDDSLERGQEHEAAVIEIQENPLVTWVQLPFDSGLSYGRNKAIELVTKPYVIICDDDYLVTENTRLERMLAVLQADEEISLVGGLVNEETMTKNWVGYYSIEGETLKVSKLHKRYWVAGGVKYRYTDVCWNFFVARSSSLKRVRWDDKLKIAAEHVDFFISRFKAGEISVYTPESCITHRKIRSTSYNTFRDRKERYLALMRQSQGLKVVESLVPLREEFEE